ncbi:mandelate racemase/muconate lactonizing enzyme family protein [Posidoniimonas corsicana]|uniref:mandelate racemase/muconate lactonizing enzyme family protein n=1 Tax=Posidoniimonas corsicana TaxID=1938618 RepID=UPI0018D2F614|nr:mandelate racemase/muconate lactonizing enzyme family protein [Posidoniimonas corsicana]
MDCWSVFPVTGHPLQIGEAFQRTVLQDELDNVNQGVADADRLPLLAALLCCSAFDIALYDAFGNLHGIPAMHSLTKEFCSSDLSSFLDSDDGVDFRGRYPADYLRPRRLESLPAWHLVGGADPLTPDEAGAPPAYDGHPVFLSDWIKRDGLKCLKVKLRGSDYEWDLLRLTQVGEVAQSHGVEHLTADFNCTVTDPNYVVEIIDQLARQAPAVHDRLLYIEQPFPYDLEKHMIDVREVSRRKPLLMDESAHNWELVRVGRALGWTGVALKTCKTLTGALLSLCWAKAHGMGLMVQDLTNPMLAQIPHLTLAAYTETLMGVETNAMQFYPDASAIEASVHPGIYRRRSGRVELSTLGDHGFGYRIDEIDRILPAPVASRIAADGGAPLPHFRSRHADAARSDS